MASFVSSLPAFESSSSYDRQPTQEPQPTTGEQMQLLEQQGQSASQIAEALGVPLSQVQSDLGLTATAAASPLSVKA